MNKFQKAFPNGSRVQAFDEIDGWKTGNVSIHTENRMDHDGNGLIVKFDDGSWTEYPYSYIDLDDPKNSLVDHVFEV